MASPVQGSYCERGQVELGTVGEIGSEGGCLTTHQLYLFNGLYLAVLAVVTVLTRATVKRFAGALAGAVVDGVALLGIVALGEQVKWWHFVIAWEPYFLTLFLIGCALGAFVFLLTWRISRRFGWRGLVAALIFAALIGPPRDYWYMARFPEWGAYAPGISPVLAISAAYVLLGILGHGVMRLVAGPASADQLARPPWSAS